MLPKNAITWGGDVVLDKAIWMSWYDLPEQGREGYLSWLHETYIPKITQQPGVRWAAHYASNKVPPAARLTHIRDASVPTGSDFILLFGGENSYTFTKGADTYLNPAPGKPGRLHAGLTDEDRKMLAMRVNERVSIMIEEGRVDGPEVARRDRSGLPGPSIQLGNFCANSVAAEEELLSWFGDWRLGALSKLPGCIGARTLLSSTGWAKHGCLYEFVSNPAREENYPKIRTLYPDAKVWTERFTRNLIHAPGSPMVATRIWPPAQ